MLINENKNALLPQLGPQLILQKSNNEQDQEYKTPVNITGIFVLILVFHGEKQRSYVDNIALVQYELAIHSICLIFYM